MSSSVSARVATRRDRPHRTGAGRQLFVPRERVGESARRIDLTGETLSPLRFERREGEVCSAAMFGRRLISVDGPVDHRRRHPAQRRPQWLAGGGIDSSPRAASAGCPPPLDAHATPRYFVDWSQVEPFVGHVPTSRLPCRCGGCADSTPPRRPHRRSACTGGGGHHLRAPTELEVDVFEELNTEHQVEFLRSRSTRRPRPCSRAWAPTMPPTSHRARPGAARPHPRPAPGRQAGQGRALLSYSRERGRLISPDFVAVAEAARSPRRWPRSVPRTSRRRCSPTSSSPRVGPPGRCRAARGSLIQPRGNGGVASWCRGGTPPWSSVTTCPRRPG